MFVGHYAAALAAKAAAPRAPLWTYIGAAQLMDIGWTALVMTGVEKLSFDTTLPGSPLVLEHMPWSHSLPAAAAWALAALLASRLLIRLPWTAAAMVAAVVLSHWGLDWLVHRPDLEIWPGGVRVGLAGWDWPTAEKSAEMGLIAVTGGLWLWRRGAHGRSAWPAVLFLAFLTLLQVIGELTEPTGSTFAFARLLLATYIGVIAVAWLVDRGRYRDEA